MTAVPELPELPPTALRFEVALTKMGERLDFTETQMRAYGQQCYEAGMERAAKICASRAGFLRSGCAMDEMEQHVLTQQLDEAELCADAIRAAIRKGGE